MELGKEIEQKDIIYKVVKDRNGNISLKEYSEKYKMWFTLCFSEEEFGVRDQL